MSEEPKQSEPVGAELPEENHVEQSVTGQETGNEGQVQEHDITEEPEEEQKKDIEDYTPSDDGVSKDTSNNTNKEKEEEHIPNESSLDTETEHADGPQNKTNEEGPVVGEQNEEEIQEEIPLEDTPPVDETEQPSENGFLSEQQELETSTETTENHEVNGPTQKPKEKSTEEPKEELAEKPKEEPSSNGIPRKPVNSNNIRSTLTFLKKTFQEICSHKEIKNSYSTTFKLLEKTVQEIDVSLATESEQNPIALDSIKIFEALRSSCRTNVTSAKVKSLDGLSKLFSFQLLDERVLVNPPDSLTTSAKISNNAGSITVDHDPNSIITPPPKLKLVDAAIDTITDCFEGEVTDQKVELQIIRCLTSCILMEDTLNMCHGQSLLKAIRTIYNIFIFSLNSSNQTVAQATLIQVVQKVFERVDQVSKNFAQLIEKKDQQDVPKSDEAKLNGKQKSKNQEPLTLNALNNLNDQQEQQVEMGAQEYYPELSAEENTQLEKYQLIIKDAFLVFRSMTKISVKNIDENMDIRSHAVRSKLLSLHILHSIIRDHIDLFMNHDLRLISANGDEDIFIDSVRQYLCLSISRNSTSPITPVYEITLEIMWLLMANLRYDFKREIPVFLTEIYLPIADMKTSTTHQKRFFLNILNKLCNDPRMVIEFYLNYDCDSRFPNLLELIVDYLSRMTLTKCEITELEKKNYLENLRKPLNIYDLSQLPLLSISNLSNSQLQASQTLNFPLEYACKMSSLQCVVALLRSLSTWAHKSLAPPASTYSMSSIQNSTRNNSIDNDNDMDTLKENSEPSDSYSFDNTNRNRSSVVSLDGGEEILQQFENSKIRKNLLSKLIIIFNKKPKRAIPELILKKFIADDTPVSIAKFLLSTDGLDLATVGDYLGEADDKNIAIMHAFVEQMDFAKLSFIDALRFFLQKFRLPGEGQKIDRFMLKFAERFVEQNPNIFAKADTAYVLAYSVIMLNTDLHSPQIKHRMTLDEFLDNTAGINDGQDLPKDYVVGLYNEIEKNEIKLLSEQHDALLNENNNGNSSSASGAGTNSAFNFFNSRDLNREAYMQVSKEISTKTENAVKNLTVDEDDEASIFYVATHVEHVKFVFETLWMSFLASLTSPFRDNDDPFVVNLCLQGLQFSVRISATFGIEMARTSFVGAFIQFCNITNAQELKRKNVDAISKLFEVALLSGNFLKDSWKDVLLVVSQVERLQLIAKGIDKNSVPDVNNVRVVASNGRSSLDSTRSGAHSSSTKTSGGGFFNMSWAGLGSSNASINGGQSTVFDQTYEKHLGYKLKSNIAQLLVSGDLVILMDKIFSDSCNLSAQAIIDFIKALTQVCIEEIDSSLDAAQPRIFSLQKMIDVCYYNMNRIRVEWSPIWNVMGSTFIQIAANQKNLVVTFFAIDSLRQLSMRFLDIEELQGFEFQCDFLKPFVYILKNSFNNYQIQEMCLECFNQFIVIKGKSLKSGWKPILESLQYVSEHSTSEKLSIKTLDIINMGFTKEENFINLFNVENEKLDVFLEYIYVYKEICKQNKYPKISLRALNDLKKITVKIASQTFVQNKSGKDDVATEGGKEISEKLFDDVWYPILFTFNDIIMNSKDMEVRSCCLHEMFEFLFNYGSFFSISIWNKICNKILFPIFSVLKTSSNETVDKFNSHDDLSVWLNTTMIQALRNTIALFTHYYDKLDKLIQQFLNILVSCICQENDTIARIGRTCLQQLILENVTRYDKAHWDLITKTFYQLFESTTAKELFFDYESEYQTNGTQSKPDHNQNQKQDVKSTIVIKCILQLMVIELLSELFENEHFVNYIPNDNVMELIEMLEKSYNFSKKFNDDYELRTKLVELRVVSKIPNLLKQESSSAAVLISCLFRLYFNNEDEIANDGKVGTTDNTTSEGANAELLQKLFDRLLDISLKIIQRYNSFDDLRMEKNIITMTPVIIEILQGINEFDNKEFAQICCFDDKIFYKEILTILSTKITTTTTTTLSNYSSTNVSIPNGSNNGSAAAAAAAAASTTTTPPTVDLRSSIRQFLERVGDMYIREDIIES
ncbi:hypothetical protein ACO0QE_002680 [Hanseniaspora vineae]